MCNIFTNFKISYHPHSLYSPLLEKEPGEGLRPAPKDTIELLSLKGKVKELTESLRRSEKEVRETWEVLKESQRLFPGLIIVFDSSLRIISASEGVKDIGVDSEEIKGKNLLDLFAPKERDSVRTAIRDLEGEVEVKGKVYRLRVGALEDGRFLLMGSDISDEKRRKERLEESWRLAILGEALTSVVHDIAQPLSAIKASIYSLKRGLADAGADVMMRIHAIEENLKRVDSILEHLRDFASGTKRSGREKFNLNELIKDVVERIMLPEFKEAGIELKLELEEKLPRLRGDPYRIEEVIVNLLSNAVSALKEASKRVITIRTRYLRDKAAVLLEISDTGRGVPEEIADKIFNAFFTTKEKGEGTGMGLPISRRIVEEHGGRIYFENNPEGGTTFYVEIPIHPP